MRFFLSVPTDNYIHPTFVLRSFSQMQNANSSDASHVRFWLLGLTSSDFGGVILAIALTSLGGGSALTSVGGISSQSKAMSASPCETESYDKINLNCEYAAATTSDKPSGQSCIAINRAAIAFETKHDNVLSLDLTVTAVARNSQEQTVYIEIDGDSGDNFIRRPLPLVDFRKLEPGTPLTFTQRLRVPALQPDHYIIYLWIPSTDPALKFSAEHSLLLSNPGVAEKKLGLNKLAAFTVKR
jgi:hypothetical protein